MMSQVIELDKKAQKIAKKYFGPTKGLFNRMAALAAKKIKEQEGGVFLGEQIAPLYQDKFKEILSKMMKDAKREFKGSVFANIPLQKKARTTPAFPKEIGLIEDFLPKEIEINKDIYNMLVKAYERQRLETASTQITKTNITSINKAFDKAKELYQDNLERTLEGLRLLRQMDSPEVVFANLPSIEATEARIKEIEANRLSFLADNTQKALLENGKTRAKLITYVESSTNGSVIRDIEAQSMTGVVMYKAWDGTLDNLTRQAHREADQEYRYNPVKHDEYFIVGGEKMLYPRDMAASKENTINCRCWAIYTNDPESL